MENFKDTNEGTKEKPKMTTGVEDVDAQANIEHVVANEINAESEKAKSQVLGGDLRYSADAKDKKKKKRKSSRSRASAQSSRGTTAGDAFEASCMAIIDEQQWDRLEDFALDQLDNMKGQCELAFLYLGIALYQ